MIIKNAVFTKSSPRVQDAPTPDIPEYAFIGRSNVGKSSLINMLTGRKKLAKTSNTPGKTQLINYFLINRDEQNKGWYLVDLPGYGYAKVSKVSRKKWERIIRDYLIKRENLQCVFTLIDSRIPPQQPDLDFIDFLGEMRIPFVLAFTKTDKQSPKKTEDNIKRFLDEMGQRWEILPQHFLTSAINKAGKEELLDFIDEVNEKFNLPETNS
jgi:GTP-binding protein